MHNDHANDNDPASPTWVLRELPDGTTLCDLLTQVGGVSEPEARERKLAPVLRRLAQAATLLAKHVRT